MPHELDAPFPAPWREGMSRLDRVSLDPAIRFGKPCVRGTRISVGDVLDYLAFAAERERRIMPIPAT